MRAVHAIQYMSAIRRVLAHGPAILKHTNSRLDVQQAERAVDALVCCEGKRYFTGLGKSGHAAARMASSLSSIGLPSHFIHGAEWAHGEFGAIERGDIIVGVSQSGRTLELIDLMDRTSTIPIDFIALTGNPESALARRADVALTCAVPDDAELLGILPTASVLAAHHVFNSILSECAERLQLKPEDIGRHHPGGSIGRTLEK